MLTDKFSRFVVWSNAFYLLPLTAALYARFWADAVVLAALIVVSTAFHLSGERRFVVTDIVVSAAVILVNAAACYLGGFRMPYFAIVCILLPAALYVRFVAERNDRGSVAHGWWHFLISITLSFCVLVYTG